MHYFMIETYACTSVDNTIRVLGSVLKGMELLSSPQGEIRKGYHMLRTGVFAFSL